jgi:hypothetical protein
VQSSKVVKSPTRFVSRETFSLLLVATALLTGCGDSVPGEPKLPQSAAPGWTRKSLAKTAIPAGIEGKAKPECWKAEYASKGSAEVTACGFAAEGSAFEAMQKGRAEADTVKFQEGKFYVVVQWHDVSRDEITSLVRAVQGDLKVK